MTKPLKSGISQPIICKGCKRKVGTVRLKAKVKWRTVRWAVGLGLLFEVVANILVYLLFSKVF